MNKRPLLPGVAKCIVLSISIPLGIFALGCVVAGVSLSKNDGFLSEALPLRAQYGLTATGAVTLVVTSAGTCSAFTRTGSKLQRALLGLMLLFTVFLVALSASVTALAFLVSKVTDDVVKEHLIPVDGHLSLLEGVLYHSIQSAFLLGYNRCSPTCFLTDKVQEACNANFPNSTCARQQADPAYLGLFCRHGRKHVTYTVPDQILAFPDPSASSIDFKDGPGSGPARKFAHWVNWACMPTLEENNRWQNELLMHDLRRHENDRRPANLTKLTRDFLAWEAKNEYNARLWPSYDEALQGVWERLREKARGVVPSEMSIYAQCYESSWWEHVSEKKPEPPMLTYPNGTNMTYEHRQFFSTLGPKGGVGIPIGPKEVFCYCAVRGTDALQRQISSPKALKWAMLAVTICFFTFALVSEVYLICCAPRYSQAVLREMEVQATGLIAPRPDKEQSDVVDA